MDVVFNRAEMLARVADHGEKWDVLVIGGGATGLGAALDAVTRGYKTLLVERGDFACGTSSRSTKLIHGGVRYLRQGNVALVRESLRERELLLRNAPQFVTPRAFVVPDYKMWDRVFYGTGLKIYGLLASESLPQPRHLSRDETLHELQTLNPCGLRGGELYHDAQFDDARLAIALAQNIVARGGVALNYMAITALGKSEGRVHGARAVDAETNTEYQIEARVVINATGVFTDSVRRFDEREATPMLAPSQGAHIILSSKFLPGHTALMVPRTDDGRVLFAIPWLDRVLVGTTDTAVSNIANEPRPLDEEIEFLLGHAARYFTEAPQRDDILSTFAGLRPLVKSAGSKQTSRLARDHVIEISPGGLVTITGGKWTTFRRMAEDVVDEAIKVGSLEPRACVTKTLPLETDESATGGEILHRAFPYREGDVRRAVQSEMARTVEDVLSRRTRALLLDARASMEVAPRVASLLAAVLHRDAQWERDQTESYFAVANGYCVSPR